MYIKNQKFGDEEALLEALFDFALGETAQVVKGLIVDIDKELESNLAYKQYYNELKDADDKAELYTEERDIRLAEQLMSMFDSFEIYAARLYGVKNGERTLLYSMNLH